MRGRIIERIPADTPKADLAEKLAPVIDMVRGSGPVEREAYLEVLQKRFKLKVATLKALLKEPVSEPREDDDDRPATRSEARKGEVFEETDHYYVTKDSSEVREALEVTSEWLTDKMLISAYDLAHEHIPRPDALTATPELIIVDSGGYEARIEHDMSAAVHWPHNPLQWNEEMLRAELGKWPDRFPASFVSFDDPSSRVAVPEQVRHASSLFEAYPKQLHTFLLKPETTDQKYLTHAIDAVLGAPHLLAPFSFIGVTEKELGSSTLERMHSVARLRLALDGAGIRAPLHVLRIGNSNHISLPGPVLPGCLAA